MDWFQILDRYGIAVADGGRIGYKAGSVDKIRRLFFKFGYS